MKLSKIANCMIGPNANEKKKLNQDHEIYLVEDIQKDLSQYLELDEVLDDKSTQSNESKFILNNGDLVINLMTNIASVVSKNNQDRIMTQALMKIEPNDQFDKWYLCYLLNESNEIKRQEMKNMEGTVIKRLTARLVKNLDINAVNINEQKRIGDIYRHALKEKYLLQHKANLIFASALSIIEND